MATNLPVEVIKKQDWLEPIADRLQPAIAGALGADGSIGPKVADLLHGTWLGHPLHVVLTDVPLGSCTGAGFGGSGGSGDYRFGRLVQDWWRPTSPHRSGARPAQRHRYGLLRHIAMPSADSLTPRRAAICFSRLDGFQPCGLSGRTFSLQGKTRF